MPRDYPLDFITDLKGVTGARGPIGPTGLAGVLAATTDAAVGGWIGGAAASVAKDAVAALVDTSVVRSLKTQFRSTDLPLIGYGDSYFTNGNQLTTINNIFFTQMGAQLGSPTVSNRGQGGSQMQDVAFSMIGEAGKVWAPTNSIVVLNAMINDAMFGQNDAPTLAGFKESLRSILRILRSASRIEHTDSACTLAGTWVLASGSKFSGGSITKSTTPGSTATFTFSGVDRASLLVYGFNAAGSGAVVDVSINGAALYTNRSLSSIGAPSRNNMGYNYTPVVLEIPPLAGLGPHTVVITHKSGGSLALDCLLVPAYTPPTVVVGLAVQPTKLGWTTNGDSNSAAYDGPRIKFRDAIKEVAAEFPNDGKIILADLARGWDSAVHLGADGLHPNDAGAASIARNFLLAMNAAANP